MHINTHILSHEQYSFLYFIYAGNACVTVCNLFYVASHCKFNMSVKTKQRQQDEPYFTTKTSVSGQSAELFISMDWVRVPSHKLMGWTELEMISELMPFFWKNNLVLSSSLISTLVAILTWGLEFHCMTRLHTDLQTNSDFIKLPIIDYWPVFENSAHRCVKSCLKTL